MTVGDGRITVQVGNLTAGELCWLGQLTELMCDPAKARQWAEFKAQARLLCYEEGTLEVVTANGVARCVTAKVNAALQAQARTHQN